VKEGAEEDKKEYKKKKSITEKYWDWELSNDTKPIWVCSLSVNYSQSRPRIASRSTCL
jgi:hypothetical protein